VSKNKELETSQNDIDLEKYRVYLDERKTLVENANKVALLFVQTVLTLAAGSFGLSFIFIKQIAPTIKPDTKWTLILAWACYCLTILVTLLALYFSQCAHLKQVRILEQKYYPQDETKKISKNYSDIFVAILTVISIVLFMTGTVFLAFFGIQNI
jgi:hypothetical protein